VRDKVYPDIQAHLTKVLETGALRFDNVEQALEERATIVQLSELSATLVVLMKRVEGLEKENTKVGGCSPGCSKLG
jgi:hypothetical protein